MVRVSCVGGEQSYKNPEEEMSLSDWGPQGRLCVKNTTMAGPSKMNMKSFCTAEETVNKMKRQSTKWEKIFARDTTDKGLISNM